MLGRGVMTKVEIWMEVARKKGSGKQSQSNSKRGSDVLQSCDHSESSADSKTCQDQLLKLN